MVSPGGSASGRSLTKNRDFMIFWAGQTLASFAESFVYIAIPLLVLDITGSVAKMGLVSSVFGLGRLLSGFITGTVVDRVDRRKLMIFCDIGRGALYLLIPLAWWLSGEHLWLVYVVALLGSIMAMFFEVAYITAVANLVDRDQIIDANGRLHATFAAGQAIGPTLAGLLAGTIGAHNAVGLIAVFYAISAFSLALIRFRPTRMQRTHPGRLTGKTLLAGVTTGGRIIFRDPLFRSLVVLIGVVAFFSTGIYDLFIYHLRDDLGQSEATVGLVFGVASSGAFLGGLLAPRLRRAFGFGPLFAAAFLVEGLAVTLIGVAPYVALVAAFGMTFLFGSSLRGIITMTLRQEVTPDHLLGRVTATFWMCFNVPGPIGAALVTYGAEHTSATLMLAVSGLITMAMAGFVFLTPARDRRPELAATERFEAYAAELEAESVPRTA